MSVTAYADYKGCVLSFLKSVTAITAIVSAANIRGNLQGLSPGGYAIAVVKTGGFGRIDYGMPMRRSRLDLHIYGSTGLTAMTLWRTVAAALEPTAGVNGFTAANCRIRDVTFESDPIEDVDGTWDRIIAPIIVTWDEVPV